MPAATPPITEASIAQLQSMGLQIRARRKALGVSATAAAEAAGVSRVTLHRVEKGEPSVAAGAWGNVLAALGMEWHARPIGQLADVESERQDRKGWIPARVHLGDYPQLRALAWQVHGTETLTPMEALGIYERNARHINAQAMSAEEQDLLDALRLGLQDQRPAMEKPGGV
ncbi:MAG: helix-turn-helix domain-containing protein [Hydrogenophaga sp.]|uniref:helix-turn-helix domain-containing protein n=1 Tax=Hydrogenophaga sp. TaxID=1904254 RepID=UPI003D135917